MRRLLHGDVVHRDGRPLGRVADVAVEPNRGVIAFITIRHGDDDPAAKTFVVPVTACHLEEDRVVLDVEPAVFARSPGRA